MYIKFIEININRIIIELIKDEIFIRLFIKTLWDCSMSSKIERAVWYDDNPIMTAHDLAIVRMQVILSKMPI